METPHYELTPESELKTRIERFQPHLRQKEVSGALISQNADLFYFSGTVQRSFLFVPCEGPPLLMVQKGYERARKESRLEAVVSLEQLSSMPALLHDCGHRRIERLGLELDVIPAKLCLKIGGLFPAAEIVDVSSDIRETRMIKSPFEIAQIKRAASICSETMKNAPTVIREGMTEIELESKLVSFARQQSHHGFIRMRGWNQEMYYGHVLSGDRGAVPSFLESPTGGLGPSPAVGQGASFARIGRGVPISIDLCFGVNGYFADHTRTFVIGDLPDRLTEDYQKLIGIKRLFTETAKPRLKCADLYGAVLEKARLADMESHFMAHGNGKVPFIGHGLGLEVDEIPILSSRSPHILEEGMVFTLEPRMKYRGIGVVGFEDDYLVTRDGVENITPTEEGIIRV